MVVMAVPTIQQDLLLIVQPCAGTLHSAEPVKLNGVGAEGFELC